MNTNDYRVKAIKDDWERTRKQFLAHAEDFNNDEYTLTKRLDGGYIISKNTKEWVFSITQDGIEQLSECPDSSSDYWAHKFMEDWMMFPKNYKEGMK